MKMLKAIICCALAAWSWTPTQAQSKVQCSCKTVSADGEGNTSCSVSESQAQNGKHCTIDFNLFGVESENRAADLLIKYAEVQVKKPNAEVGPEQSLLNLSAKSSEELLDAILVYLTVAVADQGAKYEKTLSNADLNSLKELAAAVRSPELS